MQTRWVMDGSSSIILRRFDFTQLVNNCYIEYT